MKITTLPVEREFAGRQLQAGIFRSSPGALVFIRESDVNLPAPCGQSKAQY